MTTLLRVAATRYPSDRDRESGIQDPYRGCLIVVEALRSTGIVLTDDIHGAVPLGVVLSTRTTHRSPIRTLIRRAE